MIKEECEKRRGVLDLISCKSIKPSLYPDLDKALILWIRQEREKGIPISGPHILAHASVLFEKIKKRLLKIWNLNFKCCEEICDEIIKESIINEDIQSIVSKCNCENKISNPESDEESESDTKKT